MFLLHWIAEILPANSCDKNRAN